MGGGSYDPHRGKAASWSARGPPPPKIRVTPNPLGDSSSEQNLSSYTVSLVDDLPPRSAPPYPPHCHNQVEYSFIQGQNGGGDLHWDSKSLGMEDEELRDFIENLRETAA